MIVPNTHRVIIKPIKIKSTASGLVLGGDQGMKAGENLLFGEIIHPGDTKFVKGQKVFYSGYSASAITDVQKMNEGISALAEGLVIVAQDDIMAYYDLK